MLMALRKNLKGLVQWSAFFFGTEKIFDAGDLWLENSEFGIQDIYVIVVLCS